MGEDTIIVAIVFGSILGMMTIPMLFSLAKKWIDRNKSSYDEEAFERLAKAFIQHKKEMDRRMQNIEAIVTDEESVSSNPQIDKSSSAESIEIDDRSNSKDENQSSQSGLNNMLEKERGK